MQDKSKKLGVRAWIYTRPGGSHFVLESSASFQQIENETKHLPYPSFGFSVISTATKQLPHPLGFFSFLWIENETKHLLRRFLQPYFTD